MLILANILLVVTAIIGMFLIAHHNKWGFVVFFITEICYVIIGVMTSQYGLIATAGVYLSMNIYSWQQWKRAENHYMTMWRNKDGDLETYDQSRGYIQLEEKK